MKKLLLPILSIGFLFASCDKEDDVVKQDEGTSTTIILPKKLFSDDFTATFSYDANGKITKLVENMEGTNETTYTLTYVNNKVSSVSKISTGNYAATETYVFTYTNDTQVKVELTAVIGTQNYSDTHYLVLDTKGNLLSDGESTYTYSNSNILTEDWDSASIKYTYDNKPGIFSQVKTNPFIFKYVFQDYYTNISNNAITEKYEDTEFEENENYTYTYKYNDKGFPVELKSTDDTGKVYTSNIQY